MRSRGSGRCSTGFVRHPRRARIAALTFGLLGAAGAALPAQSQPTGSIRGTVVDSLLANGPLEGARLELLELGRYTATDARGVFRFDSVPGGRYTLSYTHPDLAVIGFSPPERVVELSPGVDLTVLFTTPSAASVVRRLCPTPPEANTGLVLGTVRSAADSAPVAGVRVTGEWMDRIIQRDAGLIRRLRTVAATTDRAGRFQLCGVPNDVAVLLATETAGAGNRAQMEVDLGGRLLAVRSLSVDLGDRSAPRNSRIAGTVTDPAGRPVPGALVGLLGAAGGARTDSAGRFMLTGLHAGSLAIEARAIGFARARASVALRPGGQLETTIMLARLPVELPEVAVESDPTASDPTGFAARKLRAVGGHFISREDIRRRGTIRTEDVFRGVPGIRLETLGQSEYRIVGTRGGSGLSDACDATIFIDRVRIPLDLEYGYSLPVLPEEILGIEIYQNPATAPPGFHATGQNCAIVLIWTRRGGAR